MTTFLLTLILISTLYIGYQQYRIKALLQASTITNNDLEEDELYETAEQVVRGLDTVSTSYLQRKLRIGYSRAARMIDLLEEKGVISKSKGIKPRKVIHSE